MPFLIFKGGACSVCLREDKLIPIFASLNIAENIIKQATKNKIFAMALKGDTMEILNYHEVSGK